jgi:hypothetical protein
MNIFSDFIASAKEKDVCSGEKFVCFIQFPLPHTGSQMGTTVAAISFYSG